MYGLHCRVYMQSYECITLSDCGKTKQKRGRVNLSMDSVLGKVLEGRSEREKREAPEPAILSLMKMKTVCDRNKTPANQANLTMIKN